MFCGPAYPEERANEIIPLWCDFMESAPDNLSGLAEFSTIPHDPSIPEHAWGRRVVALAHVCDGRQQMTVSASWPPCAALANRSSISAAACLIAPYKHSMMLYFRGGVTAVIGNRHTSQASTMESFGKSPHGL
jgi:hypothetical protein